MAYHAKKSNVYHLYKNCTSGNNIETKNRVSGTGGKRLCKYCEKIKKLSKKKK